MLKIEVDFAPQNSRQTILLEPGLCSDWRREVERRLEASSFLVVADAGFARIHKLPPTGSMLGRWRYLWAAPGEDRKNMEQYAELADAALDFDPDSDTVLVGIGGGSVCDLAGFLASTLFRGMRFAVIPTTLLSQVDASFGGLNGINTRHGKNAIGSVHPPSLVLLDSTLLDTQPTAEYRRGLAEVVKMAVLDGPDFFEELRTSSALLAANSQGFVSGVVARCCRLKAGLLMTDPKNEGRRRTLSTGHLFGHVLEILAGFDGRVSHGEAVSVGLALTCDFSASRGMMSAREAGEVRELLAALRLPTRMAALGKDSSHPPDWNRLLSGNAVLSAVMSGNRTVKGRLRIPLPVAIGDCRMVEGIAPEEVAAFLRQANR